MLSFFTGSRGPHGPDLPSPFGRKFQISHYKDFVKILLTVHKRVYDMKHKMDIWFFQEEKNMKNISTKNKVSA